MCGHNTGPRVLGSSMLIKTDGITQARAARRDCDGQHATDAQRVYYSLLPL